MGTRLLPSSEDSDNNFSGILLGTLGLRSLSTRTLFNLLSPAPRFFCLLKPKGHDCTSKTAEDGLSAYSASSHCMS
jgi:hypothetical protein